MTVKDTIYNDIGQFKGIYGGWYIPWENYSVATNGDSIPVGVAFLGVDLAHYFCISHPLSSFCREIFVSDDPEGFSSWYPLFIDAFATCPNALA